MAIGRLGLSLFGRRPFESSAIGTTLQNFAKTRLTPIILYNNSSFPLTFNTILKSTFRARQKRSRSRLNEGQRSYGGRSHRRNRSRSEMINSSRSHSRKRSKRSRKGHGGHGIRGEPQRGGSRSQQQRSGPLPRNL